MHWFPLRPPDFLSKRIRHVSEFFSDSREQSKQTFVFIIFHSELQRERKIVFVYSSRRPPRPGRSRRARLHKLFIFQNSQFRFCFRAGVVSEEWHQLSGEGEEVRGEGEDVMKLFAPQQSVSPLMTPPCLTPTVSTFQLRLQSWDFSCVVDTAQG